MTAKRCRDVVSFSLNATVTYIAPGATGYVVGRLLRRFEEQDCRVRCLARRPEDFAVRLPSGLVVEHDLKRMIDCRRDNLAEILGREK